MTCVFSSPVFPRDPFFPTSSEASHCAGESLLWAGPEVCSRAPSRAGSCAVQGYWVMKGGPGEEQPGPAVAVARCSRVRALPCVTSLMSPLIVSIGEEVHPWP